MITSSRKAAGSSRCDPKGPTFFTEKSGGAWTFLTIVTKRRRCNPQPPCVAQNPTTKVSGKIPHEPRGQGAIEQDVFEGDHERPPLCSECAKTLLVIFIYFFTTCCSFLATLRGFFPGSLGRTGKICRGANFRAPAAATSLRAVRAAQRVRFTFHPLTDTTTEQQRPSDRADASVRPVRAISWPPVLRRPTRRPPPPVWPARWR